MAEGQKLTDRTEITSANDDDFIHIVQGGASYKIKKSNLVNDVVIADLISTDPSNAIVEGTDGKLFSRNKGIYVNDFGLVADGLTDNSSAFKLLVDNTDYSNFIFETGDYYFASDVIIENRNNINIISQGAEISIDKTSVEFLFDFINCDNVSITGFKGDFRINEDTTYTPSFTRIDNTSNYRLLGNIIKDCRYGVISIDNANECNDIIIRDNLFYGTNDWTGDNGNVSGTLAYGFGTSRRWMLENNYIFQANHLCLSPKGYQWNVVNNKCHETHDSSIYLRGGGAHQISLNKVIDAGKDGIKVSDSTLDNRDNIITNNYVNVVGIHKSDGGVAIISECDYTTISNNTIFLADPAVLASSGTKGIFLRNKSNNITLNIIKGVEVSNVDGIQIEADNIVDNCNISNNIIESVHIGVILTQSTLGFTQNNNIVSDNVITKCSRGIELDSSLKSEFKNLIISDNLLENISLTGISSLSNGLEACVIKGNKFINVVENDVRLQNFTSESFVKNNYTDGNATFFVRDGETTNLDNFENNVKILDRSVGLTDTLTINDDTATSFAPIYDNGIIQITITGVRQYSAIVSFENVGASGGTTILTTGSSIEKLDNTSFTGTSGNDGVVTIGADGTNFWIENRTGAQRNFTYKILGHT